MLKQSNRAKLESNAPLALTQIIQDLQRKTRVRYKQHWTQPQQITLHK